MRVCAFDFYNILLCHILYLTAVDRDVPPVRCTILLRAMVIAKLSYCYTYFTAKKLIFKTRKLIVTKTYSDKNVHRFRRYKKPQSTIRCSDLLEKDVSTEKCYPNILHMYY